MVKRRINNVKLTIIGSLVDKNYYNYLLRKIKISNLKNDVYILTNISEETKWIILSQAKILVHAKRFEPFGIAVAEGMVAGAIPVVYKGPSSGPWIDIIDKGKYGIGFGTTEELAEAIEHVISSERELFELQDKALERSRIFLLNIFEKRFMELIEGMI
jgi:glycosyltransferase involved in cell wall biosynthesis